MSDELRPYDGPKSERLNTLRELLIEHEGLRLKPYLCSEGKLTIGVGRNLEANGISRLEAMLMLQNDMELVLEQASEFPWFSTLTRARQDVILSMIFNMGIMNFKEFKRMIAALRAQNFDSAASEMLNSKWAVQVGKRAETLSRMMRTGF